MHPIFLAVNSFYIGTYGVLLAIGLLTGLLVALWRAGKVGLPGEQVMDLVFWGIIAGIVGGRLTYILVDLIAGPRQFLVDPLALILSREGFVFLGGLLAGVAVCLFQIHRRRLDVWLICDVLAPSLAIGHAIGRIGCFAAGCCYGRVCDADSALGAFAVRFPTESAMGNVVYPGLAFHDQVEQGLIPPDAVASLPVWPTQLMESFGNVLIFIGLMLLWNRRKFAGQILLAYVLLYSLLRFFLEFLRGDAGRGMFGPLSTSQIISLAGLIFALAMFPRLRKRIAPQPVASPVAEKAGNPASRLKRRRAGK